MYEVLTQSSRSEPNQLRWLDGLPSAQVDINGLVCPDSQVGPESVRRAGRQGPLEEPGQLPSLITVVRNAEAD